MDIPNGLGQLSRVDVIEIAENIDVSRCAVMGSHQGGVVLQRRLIVGDADVASLVEVRDIEMVFMPVSVDDAIGGEGRRAAMRMVDDDDILDPEQMLGDGNGAQRVDGAATGNDHRQDGGRRCDTVAGRVANDLSRKHLVAKQLRDRVRDLGRPRIIAKDHQRLERNGVREGPPGSPPR